MFKTIFVVLITLAILGASLYVIAATYTIKEETANLPDAEKIIEKTESVTYDFEVERLQDQAQMYVDDMRRSEKSLKDMATEWNSELSNLGINVVLPVYTCTLNK